MQNRKIVLSVAAVTAVGAALRFATLGRQSFWLDELVTVSLVRRGFSDMLGAIPGSEATPYVYYILAWVWTRVFGFGEAGLRSLSAVAGTATIPVAYAAGTAFVSRRIGLIAAALVAVNPFLVWYSQEARAYALFAFFAALSVLFFARALGGDRRSLAGWAVASSLAIATHYFAVFLVVPAAAWLILRVPRRRDALLASLAPAVALAAHLPLLLRQRHHGETLRQSALGSRIAGIPKDLVVGYSFPAELAGSVVAAVLVVVGVVLFVTRTPVAARRRASIAGALAAVSLLVPLVLASAGVDYVIARNMIAAIVPAAVFLAAGYAASRLGLIAAVALCALSLAIAASVGADTRYGRTDWRGAAEELRHPAAERAIVVTPYLSRTLWRPYLRGLREPRMDSVRVSEIVVIALATQGGFTSGPVHPPRTPPRSAPPGFRLVEVKRDPTLTLVRYRSQGASSPVSTAELAGLELVDVQAIVLLQDRDGHR